jgi:outer membrane protein OmpA-like peptidoglycan-associated protein
VEKPLPPSSIGVTPTPPVEKNVQFSVTAPQFIPGQHIVMETLPLSNYVFFDAGNSEIPGRYVILTGQQASSFTEAQLQDCQKIPDTRSVRQMKMYYNVLNIVADRMRRYPNSTITLVGSSSGKGKKAGAENAETIKKYFVNVFGIAPARIKVEGRSLPLIPSEKYANSTVDTDLTRVEDNRVDIISSSPDLMTEAADNSALCLKPIQVTAMDGSSPGDVKTIINANGAGEALVSWSVDVTDEAENAQHFGPFTGDTATISSMVLLKGNKSGNYKIVLTGKKISGDTIRRESSFILRREVEPVQHEQLTSILFEFDKSKTVETYKNFLVNTVAPLIPSNATVMISGHTDIVGGADYNMNLSMERAKEAQHILDSTLTVAGKTGVAFISNGYGVNNPEFENLLPEQRFYNRTVSIDIVPAKSMAKQ